VPLPYIPTLLDAEVAPDDVAAWAASVTPGSAVVKPLAVLDPRRLTHEGRVDALAALEKHIGWMQAQQHRLLAVMAADPAAVGTGHGDLDKNWVREDVACALRLSTFTAADRLHLATELTRLPATLDLLERGDITTHYARSLAEAIVGLDDATAAAVEQAVLPKATEQTLSNFRRSIKKAVLVAAPKPAEQAHDEAMTQRRVARTLVGDGMSEIWMLLPDTGASTFMTAIDALACRVGRDDPRTADQRRADACEQDAFGSAALCSASQPDEGLREDGEPYLTDESHFILDAPIPAEADIDLLARSLATVPGVVETGLFLGLAQRALLGRPDGGVDVLDAMIAGVNIVELDPLDDSVGYGGLPNAEGVVQLDAACVHGPTRGAGAVAALEGVTRPARLG